MILELFLTISIMINVVMVLYVRWILRQYKDLVQGMENIGDMLTEYVIQLKSIYELEMFYGDETLSSLLQHGREIIEKLEEIELLGENDDDDEE